jgi:hypothetical protein
VHEPVAFLERSIKNEMHVRIHQGESQDDHLITPDRDVNPVHAGDEVIIAQKHGINGVAVRTEMPAILDPDVLALDKGHVESEIRNDLSEQFLIDLHLQIRRR